MSKKTVTGLYDRLLKDSEIAPVVQERIFNYAAKNKHQELLRKLALLPNLAPGIDKKLAAFPYVKVKAAWAGRPERTTEEIISLVSKDKRSTVHEVLANLQNLPAEAYAKLAEVGTSKVLIALLNNATVPFAVKVKTAQQAGEANISRGLVERSFREALVSNPELHSAFAEKTTSLKYGNLVAKTPKLSQEAHRNLANIALRAYEKHTPTIYGSRQYYRNYRDNDITQATSTLASLAENPELDEKHAKEISEKLAKHLGNASLVSDSKLYASGKYIELKDVYDSFVSYVATQQHIADSAEKATAATDTGELVLLAQQALQDRNVRLALAVLSNPAADTTALQIAAKALEKETVLDNFLLKKSNLLGPKNTAAILSDLRYYRITDALVSKLHKPEEIYLALAELSRKKGSLLQYLGTSKYCTKETVLLLPVAYLGTADISLNTNKAVAEALATHLKSSENRWETFESLSNNFEGSLKELLEAVVLLTPDIKEEQEELFESQAPTETVNTQEKAEEVLQSIRKKKVNPDISANQGTLL